MKGRIFQTAQSQSSFKIIIPNVKNDSVHSSAFRVDSITGDKFKDSSLMKEKFADENLNDGNLLIFRNDKWKPVPLSGLRFMGTWRVEEEEYPGGQDEIPPEGHYYVVKKGGKALL